MWRLLRWMRLLVMCAVLGSPSGAPPLTGQEVCQDEASCSARAASVLNRLEETRTRMREKENKLLAFEDVREGLVSGQTFPLLSAHRERLAARAPLIYDLSDDSRHRPYSTDVNEAFTLINHVARRSNVVQQGFMKLKRSSYSSSTRPAPPALVFTVDNQSLLCIYSLDGSALLENFSLGHANGTRITHVALSPNLDNHFIASADDIGGVRVHTLKVVSRRERLVFKDDTDATNASRNNSTKRIAHDLEPPPKDQIRHRLVVYANYSESFQWTKHEHRRLTSLIAVDRGTTRTYFLTGDNLGAITVFYFNGTFKGRVRVTNDPRGVVGMRQAQGANVLYYSSYSFGFFSASQLDITQPPCKGWGNPIVNIAEDSGLLYNKVFIALADGDVLAYATMNGKIKACDLKFKFPKMSSVPFSIQLLRQYIVALPAASVEQNLRDLIFFSTLEAERNFNAGSSHVVAMKASFAPRRPAHVSTLWAPGAARGERGRSYALVRFEDALGIELYDLEIRDPPQPPQPDAESWSWSIASWFDWIPNWAVKVLTFAMTIMGVVWYQTNKAVKVGEKEAEHLFQETMKNIKKQNVGTGGEYSDMD